MDPIGHISGVFVRHFRLRFFRRVRLKLQRAGIVEKEKRAFHVITASIAFSEEFFVIFMDFQSEELRKFRNIFFEKN